MAEANKTYGFTIAVKELRETVPNIFRYASAYKRTHNLESKGLWEMFLDVPKDEGGEKKEPEQEKLPEEFDMKPPEVDTEAMEGEKYNMCHFWSNFEIARLDFFRSKEYEDFFEMMDRSGGFWMERVCLSLSLLNRLLTLFSGVTHPSILWLPEHYLPPVISIISATLDTATRQFNTALPMHLPVSYLGSHTSKRRPKTRRSVLRKTTTGR